MHALFFFVLASSLAICCIKLDCIIPEMIDYCKIETHWCVHLWEFIFICFVHLLPQEIVYRPIGIENCEARVSLYHCRSFHHQNEVPSRLDALLRNTFVMDDPCHTGTISVSVLSTCVGSLCAHAGCYCSFSFRRWSIRPILQQSASSSIIQLWRLQQQLSS